MFKSFKLKKWTAWVVTMFMILSYVSPFKVSAETSNTINLQILATSDLHGMFMPYVYATNSENLKGNLAQIATKVKELKNDNTILVDNGDTIQGNSNQLFNKDDIHPMILAMNEIGYDTWTLGNHEFNYGIPTLEKIMSKFNGTVLAGNVYKADGKPLAASYKIIDKGGVKVGIVGMTNPNITKWDAANLEGFNVTSPITEARKAVDEIKGQVDVLVGVVHVGPTEEYDNDDGADVIAKAIPEFAAIVAGHLHSKIQNRTEDGTVIVEPLNNGANIAKVDIKVTKGADGKFAVVNKATDVNSSIIAIDETVKPDTDLVAKLKPYHDRAIADARTVIGKLEGGDLVPANEVKGIPTAQIQDTAMIDLINEVQMYYTGAKVSAAAAFSTTANIKAGDITKAGVSAIYLYDNTLYKLQVTGAQLKKFMEWSASYYNTYKPGDVTLSFNENIRGYNYDMFDGVTYDVDVTKAPGSRITNLKWPNGNPVKDDETFVLAVNNYRANTQLTAPAGIFKDEAKPIILEKDVKGDIGGVRELIADYITNVKKGVITSDVNNNWKVIGNNWDAKQRALAVKLINSGKITLPLSADGRTPNVAPITYEMALAANKVNILSFNDFHGTLKEGSSSSKDIGAAKLAAAINTVRKANPDTVVVAGGDLYQGSAMSNLKYGKPVSDVIKAIGIEASALGNHEFDWGLDWISEWAKDGGFDFLASNIYSKTTGKPVTWAEPYKVVVKDGLKIGLIGIATPETAFKTKPENVKSVEFRDPVTAGNEWAKYLKETEKVDVVIALTHLGALQDGKTKEITGEAADFAKTVKGVDAVISAHTHQSVAGVVNNIPVIQGYYNGRSLAQLSIYKDVDGKVTKIVPAVDDLYLRVKDLAVDPAVKTIVDKYNAELAPILEESVGETDKDLTHDKNAAGVSVLGQWASDVMKAKAGTQIAIQNGGGLRTSISKGNITMGKMYEVMPFDNTLYKMELKGSDIKKNIENGIANSSIGWVQFSGMKVYYDINRGAGDRILGMYLMDGTKMDMDKYYTVVTNDFMATGGDGYNFTAGKNQVDTGVPIREALVEALRALKAEGKVLSVNPIEYLIASAPPVDNGAIPNDTVKVVEAVKAAAPKSTVIVDVTSNPKAAKEIFEAIKGEDKNITFIKDGVSWTFNGLNIKPELIKDIDLSLKAVSDELKAKEIAKMKAVVGKEVAIVPFSFNYDGALPGEATIKVLIGKDWANKSVYVNRYYADKNTYEIIAETTVDEDGYITFKTNHCSDYFVMEKAAALNLPKTGGMVDMGVMVNLGLVAVMIGVAMIFADRRKRKNIAA